MADQTPSEDINRIARFLAREDVKLEDVTTKADCLVFCASAVLSQAEQLFRALEQRPDLAKTLVIVGGKGHSTQHLYDAVARHPEYSSSAEDVADLPESRVLEVIMHRYFDIPSMTSRGCKILIEDRSTNCGSNAIETRKLLDREDVPCPDICIVVQDPTMVLRTIASFEKAYDDSPRSPRFLGCPIFVPRMRNAGEDLKYDVPKVPTSDLWPKQRFIQLLTGEILRLRDDSQGYGPCGKMFISHIDIPGDVEDAWKRVSKLTGETR